MTRKLSRGLAGSCLLLVVCSLGACGDGESGGQDDRPQGASSRTSDDERHFGDPPKTYTVDDLPVPPEIFVGKVTEVTRYYENWEVESEVRGGAQRAFAMVVQLFESRGLSQRYHQPPESGIYVSADYEISFTVSESNKHYTIVAYELLPAYEPSNEAL